MSEEVYRLKDGFGVKNGMIMEVPAFGTGPTLWLVMLVQGTLFAQCVGKKPYGYFSELKKSSSFFDNVTKVYKGFSEGIANAEFLHKLVNGGYPTSPVVWEKNPPKVKITKAEIAEKFGIKESQIEIV